MLPQNIKKSVTKKVNIYWSHMETDEKRCKKIAFKKNQCQNVPCLQITRNMLYSIHGNFYLENSSKIK